MTRDHSTPRRGYTRKVGTVLPASARKVFREYGFAEGTLIRHWREIAGPSLAPATLPLRMTYRKDRGEKVATLHLLVQSAAAIEVQHQIPLLIEKINIFYGYKAVHRVALVQGHAPAAKNKAREQTPPADPAAVKRIKSWTKAMKDAGLKEALIRLGEQVLRDGQK